MWVHLLCKPAIPIVLVVIVLKWLMKEGLAMGALDSESDGWSSNSLDSVLARNLVLARSNARLTQQRLAAKSRVSRATIAQLETGAGDPRLSTLSLLAEALGLRVLDLLCAGHDTKTAQNDPCIRFNWVLRQSEDWRPLISSHAAKPWKSTVDR